MTERERSTVTLDLFTLQASVHWWQAALDRLPKATLQPPTGCIVFSLPLVYRILTLEHGYSAIMMLMANINFSYVSI